MVDAIREHRPTFTVGAITVFIALAGIEGVGKDDFASFRMLYSGGAAIAPAVTDRFERQTGLYIHNIYGLTETNSPSHAVPLGSRAPVDPSSGALSVGVPVFNTVVRILGDDGEEMAVGEVGETATSGPQVVPGYWNKPEATAASPARWRAAHRRRRLHGRTGLVLPGGPEEGHDRRVRVQGVAARGGGHAAAPPGRPGGSRGRRAGRVPG
jgi:acyl-coenzyme A synthetase/AMP-(fatty) acid ligase